MPQFLASHCPGARHFARHTKAGALVAAIGAVGLPAAVYPAGLGLKPGLWEVGLVRQVVDGHDVSQQLTESIAKAQKALAHLTPEARLHVQSLLNDAVVKPGGNARI